MNTIKNIHKLAGIIPAGEITKLEAGAALHLRHSNISFKIVEVNDTELHVRADQGRHLSENYADEKTLINRTRELFGPFFRGRVIYTHPVPYAPAIVDVVDPAWIKERMLNKGIRIKDMLIDTAIDKTNLSAWINGTRPMSQPVKAMFYFYFLRK